MTGEDMMEMKIMGQRRELDKFLDFAAKHAHHFSTVELFTACGRPTTVPDRASYEVGTVDRPRLMRAYVQHVFNQRKNSQVLTQVA